MFWKNEPLALYRKSKALVVGFIASVLIGIACVILAVRGSFEATIAAIIAAAAAAATGNWAHWALNDTKKLAREIRPASSRAPTDAAGVGPERRSGRLPDENELPQSRRIPALSDRISAGVRRWTAADGNQS